MTLDQWTAFKERVAAATGWLFDSYQLSPLADSYTHILSDPSLHASVLKAWGDTQDLLVQSNVVWANIEAPDAEVLSVFFIAETTTPSGRRLETIRNVPGSMNTVVSAIFFPVKLRHRMEGE